MITSNGPINAFKILSEIITIWSRIRGNNLHQSHSWWLSKSPILTELEDNLKYQKRELQSLKSVNSNSPKWIITFGSWGEGAFQFLRSENALKQEFLLVYLWLRTGNHINGSEEAHTSNTQINTIRNFNCSVICNFPWGISPLLHNCSVEIQAKWAKPLIS